MLPDREQPKHLVSDDDARLRLFINSVTDYAIYMLTP
jgi:hypothetical protein